MQTDGAEVYGSRTRRDAEQRRGAALSPKRTSFLVPCDNACSPHPCSSESGIQNFVCYVEHIKLLMFNYFYLHKRKFHRILLKIPQFLKHYAAQKRLISGTALGHRLLSVTSPGTSLSLIGKETCCFESQPHKGSGSPREFLSVFTD